MQQINIEYDDFNRTRTVNNSGIKTKTYYDIAGRVIKEESYTDAGTAITTTEYDYMGNVKSTTSPKNEKTVYTYDGRGLLKSVKYPSNDVTAYTYDSQGNVLTVTNAGLTTQTNTYDAAGRLLTSTDAMGYTEKFVYDKIGRVIKGLDKNGQAAEYEYYYDSDKLVKSIYGEDTYTFEYDKFENCTYAEGPEGTYNYEYTYNNLLESIETPDGETINYEYDANHNVSKVTDYTGDVTTYSYNGLNKISEVKRNGTVAAQYEYYQNGALKSINYSGQGKSEFEYDGALRLTGQTNSLADGTVTNTYEYTYDLNGNQIKKIDNGNATNYTYDNMNRLKSVTEPDGTKEEYTFDGQGNIQTKTMTHLDGYEYTFKQNGKEYTLNDVSTHEITYSYDKNNRLKFEGEYIGGSGEEYEGFIEITRYSEYDNNGNMIKRERGGQVDEETELFEYNELNQLTKYTNPNGEETTYKYNPDGMRTSKINNGVETKYYWDRGYISVESVNDEYTASNYIGANGIFAREEAEDTDYMLKNGHGDVTSLVSDGMESIDYNYTAYGVEKNKEEGDTNPFRYSGEYVDEESGLIYLRNRYYDPSIGRFINEDPIKDGLNWYIYANNNPIMFVDPLGLEGIVVSGGEYSANDPWPYEFIEPALNKIWEWHQNNPSEEITWIIAMAGWDEADLEDFRAAVYPAEGINVIGINSAAELQNYINSKDIGQWELSSDRTNDKITKFALFSHGLSSSVELGYGFSNKDAFSLDKSWIGGLFDEAFSNANSVFYSCNTGTNGADSFAQAWANKSKGKTWAFVGKSDYTHIFDGQTLEIKMARFLGGFYWGGSWNLPIAGTTKVEIGPWKGYTPFMKVFSPY